MAARELWAILLLGATATLADDPAGEVVVRPESAPGPLDNPLKGWCVYADAGRIRQPYSMVYFYAPWSVLEPVEGRYAFDEWERKSWSVPEAKGKHVVFRVFVDYPSRPSGLPTWLAAQGVKQTPYKDHGGGSSPDYDDPRVVLGMERLIAALGRRYDADSRVGFIEVGLLGFWGEWHTWPVEPLYASKDTERRVLEAYRKAFPHKMLLVRLARDHAGRQPWLGFHDMFPEDTDSGFDWSFLAAIRRSGRSDNWKVAAIGGEMVPHAARRWLGPDFAQTLAMTERSHFSWVGPYGPALDPSNSPEFRERSEALVRRLGYQFRIGEAHHPARIRAGREFSLGLAIENEGVAPFYYPWPVELALIDASGRVVDRQPVPVDIRTWLPGTARIAATPTFRTTEPGRYRLALGILDPRTNEPAIGFASKLERVNGWTILSAVEVAAR